MKLSTIHDAIKAYKEGYRWAARSSESPYAFKPLVPPSLPIKPQDRR